MSSEGHKTTNAKTAHASRWWAWGRVVLALLALPVATWLLVRGLLAPVAGPGGVDNATFGSVWGVLLLFALPIAMAFALRSRAERWNPINNPPATGHQPPTTTDHQPPATGHRPPTTTSIRNEAHLALYGLAWLTAFAIIATLTLALFWRPAADGFAPPYLLVALFWLVWGGMWMLIWFALRWLAVPAAAAQLLIGGGAVAFSTKVIWLDPWLMRIAEPAARLEAMGMIVWTSPLYGWVALTLGIDLFRTGAMYHGGAGGQAALSSIGDYIGSIPHWPSLAQMLLTWLALGATAAVLGATAGLIRRKLQAVVRNSRTVNEIG